ncbi:uncharacterized protein [Castor canadensis]|uniref:Uncharacterized protein n=1 Tax=Castor canadensis TaxID=51338 RepID=A0AC58NA76_CASCN
MRRSFSHAPDLTAPRRLSRRPVCLTLRTKAGSREALTTPTPEIPARLPALPTRPHRYTRCPTSPYQYNYALPAGSRHLPAGRPRSAHGVELGPQPIGEKRPTSLMLIGCVARTVGWKEALGPGASRVGVWGTAGVSIAAEGREPGLLRVQPVRCPGKLRLLVIKRNVRPAVGVERGDINLAPTGWARHWLASPLVPRAMEEPLGSGRESHPQTPNRDLQTFNPESYQETSSKAVSSLLTPNLT